MIRCHTQDLLKLKYEGGLDGTLLTWMEDFLRGRKMRTGVRDCVSDWRDVSSGVSQGAVLAPIMFLIYVNDLVDGIGSYASLFADDVKIMKRIERREDCMMLQDDLNKIFEWSQCWKIEFNTRKCKVLRIGKCTKRIKAEYKMGNAVLQ